MLIFVLINLLIDKFCCVQTANQQSLRQNTSFLWGIPLSGFLGLTNQEIKFGHVLRVLLPERQTKKYLAGLSIVIFKKTQVFVFYSVYRSTSYCI